MKRAVIGFLLAVAVAQPGAAVAQSTVFDSCDVRFLQSGTYVVASNHDGSDSAEATIASVCADMVQQGAVGIAKNTRLPGTHQVCTGYPSAGALVVVASTYTDVDWQIGTALCNSAAWMSPAKTIAESQAAEAELNALLNQPPSAPPSVSVSNSAVVDDYVAGEFEGWSGDTVFQLRNGQIWEQAEYSYQYFYAYSPRVLIYPASGGWRMQVEGMTDTVAVRRLR